jgi:hypothetical protein
VDAEVVVIEVDYNKHQEIIEWLHNNVQENCNPNMGKYTFSAVSRFVEWRSKDYKAWVFRISGMPPVAKVSIEDEKMRMLFTLRWS